MGTEVSATYRLEYCAGSDVGWYQVRADNDVAAVFYHYTDAAEWLAENGCSWLDTINGEMHAQLGVAGRRAA